jgi:acyl-CoA reductase-like NAD-dependent aldehyde dehydrogenase
VTQVAAEVHGSVAIPEAEHRIEPTSQSRLDEALAILEDSKRDWVALDIDERIDLLQKLNASLVEAAESWVAASVQAKRMTAGTAEEGEEWLTGPGAVARNIALLISSLGDIRDYGVPQLPKPAYERPDGQVVAPVLPSNGWDGLLFQGFTAEVWMQPGVKLQELQDNQATF